MIWQLGHNIHASALSGVVSKSFECLRKKFSQPKLRSMTHRHFTGTKPWLLGGREAISTSSPAMLDST